MFSLFNRTIPYQFTFFWPLWFACATNSWSLFNKIDSYQTKNKVTMRPLHSNWYKPFLYRLRKRGIEGFKQQQGGMFSPQWWKPHWPMPYPGIALKKRLAFPQRTQDNTTTFFARCLTWGYVLSILRYRALVVDMSPPELALFFEHRNCKFHIVCRRRTDCYHIRVENGNTVVIPVLKY